MFTIKEEVLRLTVGDFVGDADEVANKFFSFIVGAKHEGYLELDFEVDGNTLILFGERVDTDAYLLDDEPQEYDEMVADIIDALEEED